MEEKELEVNFPANVKLKGKDDNWTATISRNIDGKNFPVTTLKNLTSAECYTRLGAEVPRVVLPEEESREAAVKALRDGLTSIGRRSILTATEAQDIFLDALNSLGWEDDNED